MVSHLIDTIQRHTSMRADAYTRTNAWRVQVVSDYQAHADDLASTQSDLAARVAALTGRALAPEAVEFDAATRLAHVTLDGVRFQLLAGSLAIVQPCAECGRGALVSPPIGSRADLGYALAGWQPQGGCCTPDDDEDWALW